MGILQEIILPFILQVHRKTYNCKLSSCPFFWLLRPQPLKLPQKTT